MYTHTHTHTHMYIYTYINATLDTVGVKQIQIGGINKKKGGGEEKKKKITCSSGSPSPTHLPLPHCITNTNRRFKQKKKE